MCVCVGGGGSGSESGPGESIISADARKGRVLPDATTHFYL